jgi:hypothetical protein
LESGTVEGGWGAGSSSHGGDDKAHVILRPEMQKKSVFLQKYDKKC